MASVKTCDEVRKVRIVKMWHEQRREEKRITRMLVDRRKRAERRRDYKGEDQVRHCPVSRCTGGLSKIS